MIDLFYCAIFALAGAFLTGLVIINHVVAHFLVRMVDPKYKGQVAIANTFLFVMVFCTMGIIAFSGRWLMIHNENSLARAGAFFLGAVYALVKGLKIIKRRKQARKSRDSANG